MRASPPRCSSPHCGHTIRGEAQSATLGEAYITQFYMQRAHAHQTSGLKPTLSFQRRKKGSSTSESTAGEKDEMGIRGAAGEWIEVRMAARPIGRDRHLRGGPIWGRPRPSIPRPSIPRPSIPRPSIPRPSRPRPSIPRPSRPRPSIPRPSIPRPSRPRPSPPWFPHRRDRCARRRHDG